MRVLFLLLALGFIIFITILVFVFTGYTGYVFYTSMKNSSSVMAESVGNMTNTTVNVSDYDIMPHLQSAYIIINVALILAFIIATVAIFMHTKKR